MKKAESNDSQDFSLVLGGPLYQFYRRAYLSGDDLELAWRRVIVISLIAWLPLLVLSMIDGHAVGGGSRVPFVYDVLAHVRFLIALPILIGAEVVVHSRIRPAVQRFLERRIIVDEEIPKFHEAVESAKRVRNSVAVEVGLLIVVCTVGLYVWRTQIAIETQSWYSMSDGSGLNLTLAGYWYAFVSTPIFQFIFLRWYLRFFIWFVFLWRVSKLNLRLLATHPDRAGGLGFLGVSSYAFSPILFAQGTLVSAMFATRILYHGESIVAFRLEAVGLVVFFMFFILSPLLVFAPHLSRAKRRGLRDYGTLGSRYVQAYHEKWVDENSGRDEELLGSADIQSLADLGSSYEAISDTRLVPFGVKDLARLALATAAPLLPLVLTVISLEELVRRLIKILL